MRPDPVQRSERARRSVPLVLGTAVVLLAVGLSLSAATAGGATGDISVDQTPSTYEGACVPSVLGRASWSYDVDSSGDHFRLTVHNPTTLCDGVDAIAVIYAMPGDGTAWPQRLEATERFTIREASTTVITFTKDCRPVQFDVLTGDTPTVIDVIGPYHGPLLFPGDLATSEQHHGPGCAPATSAPPTTGDTTTLASTTSTSSTTTSAPPVAGVAATRTPPEVAGLAVSSNNTPTGPQSQVLGSTTNRTAGNSLAFSGARSALLAGAGLALLAAGAIAMIASQRSTRTRS